MARQPNVNRRTLTASTVATGLVLAMALAVPMACGDDDSSDTASVCDSRDDLQESIRALGNVDVLRQGTNGLEDAADDVRDALDDVRQAAQDEFGPEIDAVETALGALGDALRSFTDQGSTSAGVNAVIDAATQLRDATSTLADDVQNECR